MPAIIAETNAARPPYVLRKRHPPSPLMKSREALLFIKPNLIRPKFSFEIKYSKRGLSPQQVSAQGADLRFAEIAHHLEPCAELIKAVEGAGNDRGFTRHAAVF